MRRLLLVGVVLCVVGAACSTSGSGGGSGSSGGAGKPPCTAGVVLPSTPVSAHTPPTIVDDPPTDLQMESPGFGVHGTVVKISADDTKLLFRTQSQSAVPGGFGGDTAWVVRDRTTGVNTLVMPTVMNRDLIYPDYATFMPDNSVAFTELGWWQPLAPDQQASLFNIYLSQVFRWDANTHEYTNLSLGPDGQPIGVLPPGAFPASGAVSPAQGPDTLWVTPDGRYLFFTTRVPLGPDDPPGPYANEPGAGVKDLFRRDLQTGEIVKVNVGNHPELGPLENGGGSDVGGYSVSDDGNYVAFSTPATAGLAETGYCPYADLVFLRDIDAGTTTLVSRDESGAQRYGYGAMITPDGRYVSWLPFAYDDHYATGHPSAQLASRLSPATSDRLTDTQTWIVPTATGMPANNISVESTSADGNLQLILTTDDGPNADGVIPGDGDGRQELVVYNRSANTLRKVSDLADGTELGIAGRLSPDGSRLFFGNNDKLLPTDTYTGPLAHLYSVALN